MQERLRGELARRWPAYGLLGEEMTAAEQEARIAEPGPGLWVVDPLDGTSNFAAGIPFFSVSLALLTPAGSALGVVYDPARDELFAARRGAGAWLDGVRLAPGRSAGLPLKRAIAAVDFKRLAPELARRFAEAPPYASQRSFGSVALDWCWVAAGRFHVYLHGRQKLWDYAAGALILAEAGGHAATLEGEPVPVAATTPRSALAALDADLFRAWRDWLGVPRP
jgi:myo-inositol-1(or 4)-monophosphatase